MERPILADWTWAFFASLGSAIIVFAAIGFYSDRLQVGWIDTAIEVLRLTLLMFAPGAALGAWSGVVVARRYGAVHPWRAGWVVGVVFGGLVTWAAMTIFTSASAVL
ncbi:MAG: hypothetical protein CVT69_01400 [Actinobacteria bacterium HGW-Actinobacteria-9]|jgi:hypothetical protein|nr:MAG: hypothetical protein CVT69_01400 [Actinobacteria bacterium HGW-Actinobacteria-9]